jgi:hypothetical protein
VLLGASAKLACVVLSATLSVGGLPQGMFVSDPITPASAAGARFSIEQQGQQLSAAGAHDQAAQLYWQKGVELKDPLLIVQAAEAWREHARKQRSIDAANSAIATVQVALDMLYFLRDSATSADWQPIEPAQVHMIIGRGEVVISEANALIAEIEDEIRRANEPPPEPKGPKPGTGLIAGGSVMIVVGLGGAGLGVAGLFMGAAAQRDVEDPLVYEPEHSEAEARGRRSNVFAGVGLALAGVGVGVGAALIALGVKKRKLAGGAATEPEPSAMIVPSFSGSGAGLSLVGRF